MVTLGQTFTSDKYKIKNSDGDLLQGSMTVMDYQGRIMCLVGGTGEKTANRAYNRATDSRAKRQPGSSIKPLAVYAPAVDRGIVTSKSVILEEAIVLKGEKWPRNFNGDHGSGEYVTEDGYKVEQYIHIEEISDIRTAVSEAVTNSIIHGYEGKNGIIFRYFSM